MAAAAGLALSFFLPMGYSDPNVINPDGVHRFDLAVDPRILIGAFLPLCLCWPFVYSRAAWMRFTIAGTSAALALVPLLASMVFGFKDASYDPALGYFLLGVFALSLLALAAVNGVLLLASLVSA